jgi:hypothetical protein
MKLSQIISGIDMKKPLLLSALITLAILTNGFALEFMGGQGLFYTQSAKASDLKQLNITLYERAFLNFSDTGPGQQINTSLNANYTLTSKFELGLTQILLFSSYSPSTDESKMKLPGNTYFHFKYSGWKMNLGEYPIFLGLSLSTMWRTGIYQNAYLETPYSTGAVEGGANLLVSYYSNPDYLEESNSFHFNLGFKNLNDDSASVMESTQEIPFTLAYVKSDLQKELALEMHGSFFLNRAYPYSATSFLYLCPSFKYKFDDLKQVAVGLDIKVFEAEDEVYDIIDNQGNKLPRYSFWRLNLAFTGMFNHIRYASPRQIKELEEAEARTLEAEQLLEQKRSERMEWEQKVSTKESELEQKKTEKSDYEKKVGK